MLGRFRLGTRFTILVLVVFAVGSAISAVAFSRAVQSMAEESVRNEGLVLLQTMGSVRDYTSQRVDPVLLPLAPSQQGFIAETVPAFSARAVFDLLRTRPGFDIYYYKEAAFNPTNPRNRVDDFEAGLLSNFRANPSLGELSGYRTREDVPVFYIARPMKVAQSCLQCHDTPETAPRGQVALYGPVNGFGWKLNETIATQTIYVPARVITDYGNRVLLLVLAITVAGFAVVGFGINILLRRDVINPVMRIAEVARRVGAAEIDESEPERLSGVANRRDELGELGRVFQGMAREVYAREQRLRQQLQELRIEIDETRKSHEVAEITETEYFQQLQKRAREFRKKSGTPASEEGDTPKTPESSGDEGGGPAPEP